MNTKIFVLLTVLTSNSVVFAHSVSITNHLDQAVTYEIRLAAVMGIPRYVQSQLSKTIKPGEAIRSTVRPFCMRNLTLTRADGYIIPVNIIKDFQTGPSIVCGSVQYVIEPDGKGKAKAVPVLNDLLK